MVEAVVEEDRLAKPQTVLGKVIRVPVLLLRIYVPCLLGTPFVIRATDLAVGLNQRLYDPFSDLGQLLAWSIMMFFGASVLGLPLAIWVTRMVRPFWARLMLLVVLGALIIVLALMLLTGNPLALFGAPAGAVTAFFCCIGNFDKLRQPRPRLL